MVLDATLDASSPLDKPSAHDEWQEQLVEQLLGHHLFRRRQVRVDSGDGVVVLTGRVNSFYEKQLAQELIRRCDGVQRIDNELEVIYA